MRDLQGSIMEERKGPYRDNFEAASERGRPAPVATSFLEDFPGENQPNLQRRPTQISHSLTASQRNTPNSLQPSYRHTATIGYETPDLLNFEDALSENNLRLESPYRPLELPSRFGFEEESSRRSYTPFPTLDTPPQSQSRLRRRRSSADSLFDSSSHTTQSNPFNTFVVLTQDSPIMPASSRWSKSSKDTSRTTSEAPPRPAKRRKPEPVKTEIEEVDLRDVESDTDLARVLERQRVASVKAQQEEADKPTKLANVTCVVCMEELTNITATHCGKPPSSEENHGFVPEPLL